MEENNNLNKELLQEKILKEIAKKNSWFLMLCSIVFILAMGISVKFLLAISFLIVVFSYALYKENISNPELKDLNYFDFLIQITVIFFINLLIALSPLILSFGLLLVILSAFCGPGVFRGVFW